jgi:hypothetical protein
METSVGTLAKETESGAETLNKIDALFNRHSLAIEKIVVENNAFEVENSTGDDETTFEVKLLVLQTIINTWADAPRVWRFEKDFLTEEAKKAGEETWKVLKKILKNNRTESYMTDEQSRNLRLLKEYEGGLWGNRAAN